MYMFLNRAVTLAFVFMLTASQVFAQDALEGKVVAQQDWIDRLPIIIGIVVVTIVIDVVFVVAFRKPQNQ